MNTQIKVLVLFVCCFFAIPGRSETVLNNHCVQGLSGVATTGAVLAGAGKITVATMSTTAPSAGMAGWIGFTTTSTTVIAVPVAAFIIAGGLLAYGAYVYFHPTDCSAQIVKN